MDFGDCFVIGDAVIPNQVEMWLHLISMRKADGSKIHDELWRKTAISYLVDVELMDLLDTW